MAKVLDLLALKYGQTRTQKIEEIAQTYGLSVMYDAAHAFACRHQDKR